MGTHFRIPDQASWPGKRINTVIKGDSYQQLRKLPDESVALCVTSPPYWDIVDYGIDGQIGQTGYEAYLAEMLDVWRETTRVLIPNGKLAIITPIMPISKSVIDSQHTRHYKNISNDIEFSILNSSLPLHRYSLFIWQKQTSVKMFGSYPFPPNIYEDNTVEFINVFVKHGAPPTIDKASKEPSRLSQQAWLNLTMQIWPIYPEDVKRAQHPAPFPVVLPQRLIWMYTFAENPDTGFAGDIVLDPFCGTGSTCLAARSLKRNYIGIELHPDYVKVARERLRTEPVDPDCILLQKQRVRQPESTKIVGLFGDDE
jgi:DNA modification methylase